jgi:chromosome segregation ATPase
MASQLDPSEFVDDDFHAARVAAAGAAVAPNAAAPPGDSRRAPTREEVEARVTEMQQKLAELRAAQQALERERAGLEELRRRQAEFQTGRNEMTQHLTRGVGLLEEAEFAARRDAEQMAKTLAEFREALAKIEAINDQTWTNDNLNVELTRALTLIENARMEWNAARLKFSLLSGAAASETPGPAAAGNPLQQLLQERNYAELCKLGLALTWPLALTGLAIVLVLLLR